jgi:thioredoxin-like negative regulator of GroEL
VTALTASLMLQLTLVATPPQSYSDAHKAAMESGEPLLVLVGASWCPACVNMKTSVVPELERRGALNGIQFAQVDIDRQRAMASELSHAGTIPQLILYRKTDNGWRKWEVTGGQSPESVEQFIRNGLPEQKTATTKTVSKPR